MYRYNGNEISRSEKRKPYEILNGTHDNNIALGRYDANYTFELIVLAPDVSYCHLKTTFGVRSIRDYFSLHVVIITVRCRRYMKCVVMSTESETQALSRNKKILNNFVTHAGPTHFAHI